MSVSLAFKQSLMGRTPQERLSQVLKENKNRFSINKNGFIIMDLQSAEVQAELEKQITKLGDLRGVAKTFGAK
ncbi:hypothetical protein MJO48_04460 [Dickeya fangzhongdai]|uniref:hypothetical protein n=1 Tax=Dickeya fangzhongdai TaxID=1778540 RepID=UPI001EFB5DE5|nr:hypothetical protein [Dickeya fangzhongdai]ULR31956.1 hypothetical protein MJO48_04460 [Dickeya fangzhongdai]